MVERLSTHTLEITMNHVETMEIFKSVDDAHQLWGVLGWSLRASRIIGLQVEAYSRWDVFSDTA